jgi:hypothetical protein
MRLQKRINKSHIRSGKLVVFSSDRRSSSLVFSGKNQPIYFNRPSTEAFTSSVFIKPIVTNPVFSRTIQISSNVNNFNLKNQLIELGWNEIFPVEVLITINSGVTVGSTSSTSPSFFIDAFPNGSIIQLVNNGVIQGAGGKGGTALKTLTSVSITNSGSILGGGGGGGGYVTRVGVSPSFSYYAQGGGGGAGTLAGSGGSANAPHGTQQGVAGTVSGGGSFGGGGIGAAGQTTSLTSLAAKGFGGAAGKYIDGNSFVTWLTTGDLRGAIG